MKILGIDPGLATVGLGLVTAESASVYTEADWLTITTETNLSFSARLHEIATDLTAYINQTQPDLVVVEKLYFSSNKKTALDVAHARGVIVQTVEAAGLAMLEPTPMQLKSCITGDGSADKQQMQEMVKMLLHLEEAPKPDDAADALALAIFGAVHGKNVSLVA